MKKMTLPKVAFAALAVAGMMTVSITKSGAVQETFDAAYEILTPLAIDENTQLNFGQIVKPSVGGTTNTFVLAPAGGVVVSGLGDGAHAGGEQVGELAVTAGASLPVNQPLTVTPGACDDAANVTLDAIDFGTATNAGSTNFTVAVGGTLTVDGNATAPATGFCQYTVEANFT